MENATVHSSYAFDNLTISNVSESELENIYPYNYENIDFDNIDYSFFEYPKPKKSLPLWEIAVKSAVTSQVMLIAIIGNALIVMVVLWNKSLRTTTNFYIVNLAISDLLVTVSCTWVHLVHDLTEGWVLGNFFCKFNSFVQVTASVASIFSMTLIACDRFFGIVFAMKAHIIERSARHSLILIWVISIAVGIPMLFVKQLHSRQWKDHLELWCDDNWPTDDVRTMRRVYWTFVSVILFFLPIVVMAGAYCGIIKTLWTAKAPGERLAKDVNLQTKVKRKVVLMLVTILAVYGVCWFPVQFSILYSEYRSNALLPDTDGCLVLMVMFGLSMAIHLDGWYDDFSYFAYVLAFSNSAINPIIYTAFNENFRKGFRKMFGCYKKRRYTTLKRMEDSSYPSTTTISTSVTRM